MFGSIVSYFRLLSIAGVLLPIACGSDLMVTPSSIDTFYLEYRVTGGIGGINNVLVIEENEGFTYSSRDYNFTGIIEEDQREKILNGLFFNKFFMLKEEYFHKQQVMDVLTFSFTFKSDEIVKEVTGHGGVFPKAVDNIIRMFDEVIKDLKSTITSGKVIPHDKLTLEEWPFSDQVKLADNVPKKVFAGKELFDHFKERYLQGLKIAYYEDGLIYRINTNGAFGIPYVDHDEFYIKIRDSREPFQWLPEVETMLADIPPEGIMVYDANYIKIRDYFSSTYYPWYFIEGDVVDENLVYEFRLRHGSNF